MGALFVYCTFPSEEAAVPVVKHMIERKYAACANIMSGMQSFYWWEGAVQNEKEVPVIFKTNEINWPALQKAIKEMHPYKVPCIVALPVKDGYEPFLKWIDEQTLGAG